MTSNAENVSIWWRHHEWVKPQWVKTPFFTSGIYPLVGYSNAKHTPVGYYFLVLSHSLWVIFVKFSYPATLFGWFFVKILYPVGAKIRPGDISENSLRGPFTPTRFGAKCLNNDYISLWYEHLFGSLVLIEKKYSSNHYAVTVLIWFYFFSSKQNDRHQD